MASKENSIFSSMAWKLSERVFAQAVSMVISIILARLLLPNDYGIVSIVTIIIAICDVFVSAGLGNALIQKKTSDDLDNCSVLYTSLALSIIIYTTIYFLSPIISNIYGDERLVMVLRVMALRVPLGAINSFQQAYLSKKMQFKKFFWATFFGTSVSAAIGISMAYSGLGYWALVAQYLSNSFFSTILLACVIKWTPKLMFSFQRAKTLFSFGWKILCTSLLDTLFQEVRGILISLKYSSADLAFYTKGNSYPNLITTNVNVSISNVIFSAMSRVQDDISSIKVLMKKSIQISTFCIAPLLVGLAIISEEFVLVLLTDKWLPCVPFIKITCIYSIFYPIHTINIQALNAIGKSGRVLKLEIIKKIINVVIIIVSVNFGVLVIAYGALAVSLISTYINAYYSKKMFNYSFWQQLKDVLPIILCSVAMGGIVFCVGKLIGAMGIVSMFIKIVIGAVFYLIFAYLFKLSALNYIFNKIFKKELFK